MFVIVFVTKINLFLSTKIFVYVVVEENVVHGYVAPARNSRFKMLLAWQQTLTHGLQGRRPRLAGPRGLGFLGEGIGKGCSLSHHQGLESAASFPSGVQGKAKPW